MSACVQDVCFVIECRIPFCRRVFRISVCLCVQDLSLCLLIKDICLSLCQVVCCRCVFKMSVYLCHLFVCVCLSVFSQAVRLSVYSMSVCVKVIRVSSERANTRGAGIWAGDVYFTIVKHRGEVTLTDWWTLNLRYVQPLLVFGVCLSYKG